MGIRSEEICCSNHDASNRLQDAITDYGHKDAFGCITDHPGFHYNCLVAEVLDESWKTYKQMYGKAATEGPVSSRRRHTAYRNLSRFIFGFVRKQERNILPACAVKKIRSTYPDHDSTYTGFKKRKKRWRAFRPIKENKTSRHIISWLVLFYFFICLDSSSISFTQCFWLHLSLIIELQLICHHHQFMHVTWKRTVI